MHNFRLRKAAYEYTKSKHCAFFTQSQYKCFNVVVFGINQNQYQPKCGLVNFTQ